ncbi:hypothetical protein EMIHUDRAFT_223320 [Emiliania huxleyi CCMP1516]|uniref:Microbial-type PARG catalytic domain-containing protein n=2 Tax=Emiliania huxleyi TaxID=2903 RepID=A0A0D3KVK5_EMIH1|nr:hypothetical protein EMIHUDRAFT_223320 [Emiliania huxleyi CCMP1516]EOD39790.1 hypothetical protein EMIHUDRAFT_223320 [Emiliania huxleyi CCMP1516]|eukprot:XP_005792219.1 hypothetical protein EMIHUDRAFT_223320 [Emiliania huxleyi CCMP1516]
MTARVGSGRVAALNFANAHHAGGGYLTGARAQEEDLCRYRTYLFIEEDLCRLMPRLHPSLLRLRYPMGERVAFYTQTLLCRSAGSYALEHPI